MRRRLVCQLGISGALAACQPPPPAKAPSALRLAIDLWAGYFPGLLAEELGHFREAGIAVQISLPGNTDRMVAEFAAGRHDLIACALADVVHLSRGGHALRVVLQTDESAGGDKLLARAGWRPGSSLLRVGTNLGGFGELFVREYLARQGIAESRLRWVNVDAADVPAALRQGELDLGHCWDPYAAASIAEGAVEVFSSRDTPGLIPDVVATMAHTAEQRGDDLRRFAAAWFRAQAWWLAHPDEGHARLAARLGQSPAWVAAALAGVRLTDLAENRRQFGVGGQSPGLAVALARYSDFFAARGVLTRPLEAARVLQPPLLP